MGADETAEGEAILNAFGIPTFQYPDIAARIFCYMWRSTHNLQALYETPALTAGTAANGTSHCWAEEIIQRARESQSYYNDRARNRRRFSEAYGYPPSRPVSPQMKMML